MRVRETFWQCLERGQRSGVVLGQDESGAWDAIAWDDAGPAWIAVATATEATADAARAVALERMTAELAKCAGIPRPGSRVRKAGL